MTEYLREIPENPTPPGATVGHIKAADGIPLRYAHFPAEGRPLKGTVVILQGRNEAIEKYMETVRDLSARGFGSALVDLRGQGGSGRLLRDRERGHVDHFSSYVRDVEQFFEEVVLPDCRGPFFILAHSTGALIALLAAPGLVNRVKRIVLSAPLLGFAGAASMQTIARVSGLFYAVGLGTAYLGGRRRQREAGPFEGNALTSDPARYARNASLFKAHPELFLGGPTAGWIRSACLAAEAVKQPEFAASIHVPVLMIAAGADTVVSTPEIERFARRLRSGSCLTIPGARHELLQEADVYREQFFAAFDAFVPGEGVVV